jgi:hypothetical protein
MSARAPNQALRSLLTVTSSTMEAFMRLRALLACSFLLSACGSDGSGPSPTLNLPGELAFIADSAILVRNLTDGSTQRLNLTVYQQGITSGALAYARRQRYRVLALQLRPILVRASSHTARRLPDEHPLPERRPRVPPRLRDRRPAGVLGQRHGRW